MKKLEIYDMAINSIVDYSDGDVTSSIMKEYAIRGMYNLLLCLDAISILGSGSKLIALPDFTFSRNDYRFNSFFPYGSIINIDTKGVPFVPLGFRPNCCGITMLQLEHGDEDISQIKKRLKSLSCIDSNISNDDLNRGNHFIGIYRDSLNNQLYAVIHGSFSFVKSGYVNIPGLYIDKTSFWNDKLQVYVNKELQFPYLIGENAKSYFDYYTQHEKKTKILRAQIGQQLFPNSKVVFNETHEGLYTPNIITLGAYLSDYPFWAPIMLSAESDLSIVQVSKSIPEIFPSIFACPHGGGYAIKHIVSGLYDNRTNIYKLQFTNHTIMETNDIRKLIYDYRTNTDSTWAEKHNFGSIKARFSTVYNIKL